MKTITHKFALCAVLLSGCLLPVAAHAEDNQGHHQSGVIGRVQVEQVGLPHLWQVRVSTEAYGQASVIQTDDEGQFVVNLKPGTYHLTPFIGGDGNAGLVGPPIQVTVEKKDLTVVEMSLIFGPM